MTKSRAASRSIDPGNSAVCAHCGEPVKFQARVQGRQVIANVYDGDQWARVEHFHQDCYTEASEPYGPASS